MAPRNTPKRPRDASEHGFPTGQSQCSRRGDGTTPNWRTLVDEIDEAGSVYDQVRRKYLAKLHQTTGRNVIAYYSSWLQKPELLRQGMLGFEVNDGDKNAFMATIHQLDRTKGLDLFLHTPGGDVAAAESLVDYLRSMFDTDIRAIVPQIAMSAGTMIAWACK